MSLQTDAWISSCVKLLIYIGSVEQYLNQRSRSFPKAELVHWKRQNSEEELAGRLLVGEEVLLREEWAGGPTPELQLLLRNFCLTVQKARQCSSKEEGPQLNTFSVKRQLYQVVRRTRGTTWHLAE